MLRGAGDEEDSVGGEGVMASLPNPSAPTVMLPSAPGLEDIAKPTSDDGKQYGSGAPTGAPERGSIPDLLTFTPPATPPSTPRRQLSPISTSRRRSTSPDPEPLWGRNFLQFKKKVEALEQKNTQLEQNIEAINHLLQDLNLTQTVDIDQLITSQENREGCQIPNL